MVVMVLLLIKTENENFFDNEYDLLLHRLLCPAPTATPSPTPAPTRTTIKFIGIDNELSVKDILKGVFGADYNEYVYDNEINMGMSDFYFLKNFFRGSLWVCAVGPRELITVIWPLPVVVFQNVVQVETVEQEGEKEGEPIGMILFCRYFYPCTIIIIVSGLFVCLIILF